MREIKLVFNVKELAVYLGIHPVTVYNYLKRNEIPAFRIGRSWRFNKESIDNWRFEKESSHTVESMLGKHQK